VSAVVAQYHKGEQDAEGSGWNGEELDRHDVGQMIIEECSPGL